MAGATVPTEVPEGLHRRGGHVGRSVERTLALEVADVRPEPGPRHAPPCDLGHNAHFLPYELGWVTQLLELWFPLL